MSDDEMIYILNEFDNFHSQNESHINIWAKRLYAGMFIHSPYLTSLKNQVLKEYPDYTITFDVIFQSMGNEVDWHSDHESLGPFLNETPFKAIIERHFISIHFNLTRDGGSLKTLEWPILSYLNCLINKKFDIFSVPHRILASLILPISSLFAEIKPNTPKIGNTFNNLAMHSVSAGQPRTSYVLRLVKTNTVKTSKRRIENAATVSESCKEFSKFLPYYANDDVILASQLHWDAMV